MRLLDLKVKCATFSLLFIFSPVTHNNQVLPFAIIVGRNFDKNREQPVQSILAQAVETTMQLHLLHNRKHTKSSVSSRIQLGQLNHTFALKLRWYILAAAALRWFSLGGNGIFTDSLIFSLPVNLYSAVILVQSPFFYFLLQEID